MDMINHMVKIFSFFKASVRGSFLIFILSFLPFNSFAQGMAGELTSMQGVLDNVYQQMLPLCAGLIDVGRGIAGFGALWYIAHRVFKQFANAEPIDFYPLLRPFGIGLAILLFPAVIGLMNGILKPTVTATAAMVTDSNKAIKILLEQKQQAIKKSKNWQMYVGDSGSGDRDMWYKYTFDKQGNTGGEGLFDGLGNDIKFWMEKQSYAFRNSIKQWMSEVLEVLYAAAALCINTIRTFFLIVLAILGPLVFGFAIFDGFQHTLSVWLARYVNIFLWLPIANIFGSILGKIQEHMLLVDLSQIEGQGDTFFSATDTAYLIFLVIGIVGYFSVPNVANYVVHAGGGNSMLTKINSIVSGAGSSSISAGTAAGTMAMDGMGAMASRLSQGDATFQSGNYFENRQSDAVNSSQRDKTSGK